MRIVHQKKQTYRRECNACRIPISPRHGSLCRKCATYGEVWKRIQENTRDLRQLS